MKKNLKKDLLSEALKRFKTINEYSFYTEEPSDDKTDLLLGSDLDEADADPNNFEPDVPADDSKTAANNPAGPADAGTPPAGPTGAPDANQPPADVAADPAGTPPAAPSPADNLDLSGGDVDMTGGDSGDEQEIDVTDLVNSSEESKDAANAANHKTTMLLAKLKDLENRISSMDSISHKIETLEKEIVKRNPTPVEKLEMRSMDSYPYSIKLTDYWNDVDGYEPVSHGEPEKEEYVLRQDDVDSGFVDATIKDSFNVTDDDLNDYEEEDV